MGNHVPKLTQLASGRVGFRRPASRCRAQQHSDPTRSIRDMCSGSPGKDRPTWRGICNMEVVGKSGPDSMTAHWGWQINREKRHKGTKRWGSVTGRCRCDREGRSTMTKFLT